MFVCILTQQFVSTIRLNNSSQQFISTIHLNNSSQQFISTIHLNNSSRQFISTIHLNNLSQPSTICVSSNKAVLLKYGKQFVSKWLVSSCLVNCGDSSETYLSGNLTMPFSLYTSTLIHRKISASDLYFTIETIVGILTFRLRKTNSNDSFRVWFVLKIEANWSTKIIYFSYTVLSFFSTFMCVLTV